jgi:leader peptidase (prepilin peptidase)/N-methyltransferase
MLIWFWLAWLLLVLFLVGCCIGSFLNVCVARLPAGKSLFWPPSHCGQCGTPIRSQDNIPLLSYWLLGGRCRTCGTPFSMRYFWVELTTGLAFVLLFLVEIGLNIHRITSFGANAFWYLQIGFFPYNGLPFLIVRLLTFCLLLTAYCCNLERQRVPGSITLTGLLLAVLAGVIFPWPWPDQPANQFWHQPPADPRSGLQLWPFWKPLPACLAAGSWLLGLINVLAGAVAGAALAFLLRLALLRGSFWEALRHGDVAFCLLGGAFFGWQPILTAEVLVTGLVLVLACLSGRVRQAADTLLSVLLGPGLVVAWLGWPWLGPALAPILFN